MAWYSKPFKETSQVFNAFTGRTATKKSTDKQMKFQERMRDTAYQAAVLDMEKAGINPILAYKQGGAATPAGASYQAPSGIAAATDAVSKLSTTAFAAKKLAKEMDILDNVRDKSKYDAEYADFDARMKTNDHYLQALALPFNTSVQKIKNASPTLQQASAWLQPTSGVINSARKIMTLGK